MKTETWVCDRCAASGEGRPAFALTVYKQPEKVERDLCPGCLLLVVDWIDRKVPQPPIIKVRGRRLSRKVAAQIRDAARGDIGAEPGQIR